MAHVRPVYSHRTGLSVVPEILVLLAMIFEVQTFENLAFIVANVCKMVHLLLDSISIILNLLKLRSMFIDVSNLNLTLVF